MRYANKSWIVYSAMITAVTTAAKSVQEDSSWRDDPAWHDGKAEWALYDAVRTIYGEVACFHLIVAHETHGGANHSGYWFSTDPRLRHVLVQYEGPFGVRYRLKKLGWSAYWDRSQPRPE